MFDSNSDGVNIVNLNIAPTSTEIKLVTLNFFLIKIFISFVKSLNISLE